MISYLSLKRKKPVMDEHNIPNRTQPVQLCDIPTSLFQYIVLITLAQVEPSIDSAIPTEEIQPTAITTNHFCLSFISQFNTITSIIVVTQII